MQFNSLTFLIFFVIVLALYQWLPTWNAQKRLLLVASYIFYAAWNPPFVLLLLLSTLVDWHLAKHILASQILSRRRILLTLSLLCNLGILGVFKYGNFLLDQFISVVHVIGLSYQPPQWDIILPVGISFYTFQSLSYTLDVYRGNIRRSASLLDFSVFISFFPQLVAGPIVRANHFLPQLELPKRIEVSSLGLGLALLIFGLFQKVVLADAIFAPIVNLVYAQPKVFDTFSVWAAVLAFSGQIFYDFSGYSLCAIGVALCLGFHIPDNFRSPYAANSFSDFWRRWHISLSSWLRDYLYISLGGNRNSAFRTYCNLMITMLIGGFWHGASWMFVLWGGLHGVYLCFEKWGARFRTRIRLLLLGQMFVVFLITTLTWIPFRASDLSSVMMIMERLFVFTNDYQSLDEHELFLCLATIGGTLVWHYSQRDFVIEERLIAWNWDRIAFMLGASMIAIFLASGGDEHAFIYFQF